MALTALASELPSGRCFGVEFGGFVVGLDR